MLGEAWRGINCLKNCGLMVLVIEGKREGILARALEMATAIAAEKVRFGLLPTVVGLLVGGGF